MPRKRKHRIRGGNIIQNLETANRNLRLLQALEKPKIPNQVNFSYGSGRRKRGGARYALIDKYGTFIPAPQIF